MIYEKVLKAFPPPTFLNIPYVGISISDNFIRCIKFYKKNNGLELEKYGEKKLPIGLISSGIINNIDGLAEILSELKKEFNIKHARVSLPEEKAYLFTTTIPTVARKEVRSTIEFKIEENVPLPADEIVFDYMITNPVEYKDKLDVVVSALPRNIVDMYVEAVKSAGIFTLSLEIKSQAIARAILPKSKKGTYIIVHFTEEKAGLYVVSDNIVHFTSTIFLEGDIKNSSPFLSNEIKKLEAYWRSFRENEEKVEKEIDQIIICGENFDESTVPFLSAHHSIPVILGNVWTNIFDLDTTIPPIPFTESLKYAPAIGLAIPTDLLI